MKGLNLVGLNYLPSGLSKQTFKISQILEHLEIKYNLTQINHISSDRNIISLNPYHIKNYTNILNNKRNIGLWTWETLDFPKEFKKYEEYFDEILVLSDFNKKSMEEVLDVNVEVIKLPFECHEYQPITSLDRMLFICDRKSNLMRKGVKELMQSSRNIEVPLTLKILGYQNYEDNLIKIIGNEMTEEELIQLYKSHSIYTSLHKGEGFGFTIMEAMSCGIPTITTAFSGNMEFCNQENSYLISYDIFESQDENFPGRLVKPNISEFESVIKTFDINDANSKAKIAYDMVKSQYNISECSKLFSHVLQDFLID